MTSPKFFNRFFSFRLCSVQDIRTNNAFFWESKLSCVLTILRRKTPKNDKFDMTCKLYLRFSRSRSENVPEGPWINAQTCRKSHVLRVAMQTMASNLAKPKRGKTTHIGRWFRDLLEDFPTSNVKIGGIVCNLYQIYHFWTFFVIKSLKFKTFDFKKKELFVGMSWTQCSLKEQNRLQNFGDIIKKRRKSRKNWGFA